MSIKNRNPTVRPDLVLNFARSKTLDPRISFTRTTAGRYWTDAGTQTYAASGEPRFNHNPVTGDSLGLLIEEARTNSATYDSNFDNAVWTKTGVGVNTNVEATLGGYTGGDLVTVLESGGSKSINRTTTPAAGAITFSVFVKAGVSSTVDIGIYQGSWLSLYTFTLSSTGIATLSQGSGTGSITQISTTWYRCEVTAVVTNASMTYSVFPGGINNSVGNSVYLWQAQLEAGYMATSFIPTTLTFTSRSTVGTYVDSTGLIQQAAIDTARNTYNPNNLTLSPVLLIEESRANLLINSNVETDLAAWFTNGSATLVRDTTYPICDTYAVKCTDRKSVV